MPGPLTQLAVAAICVATQMPAVADEVPWVGWSGLPPALREGIERTLAHYDDAALRFVCLETRRETRYKNGKTTARKPHEFIYMMERASGPVRWRALRFRPAGHATVRPLPRIAAPEPLLFSRLFASPWRDTLRFRLREEPDDDARIALDWASAHPVADLRLPLNWTGTLHLERTGGRWLKLTSEPNGQSARLPVEEARHRQSLKITIRLPFFSRTFSLRRRPHGRRVILEFGREPALRGLPTRMETAEFVLERDGERCVRKTVATYGRYRFFHVSTERRLER